jgi:hypothetical protein
MRCRARLPTGSWFWRKTTKAPTAGVSRAHVDASAIGRILALEGKPLGQGCGELLERRSPVVAVAFAGQHVCRAWCWSSTTARPGRIRPGPPGRPGAGRSGWSRHQPGGVPIRAAWSATAAWSTRRSARLAVEERVRPRPSAGRPEGMIEPVHASGDEVAAHEDRDRAVQFHGPAQASAVGAD